MSAASRRRDDPAGDRDRFEDFIGRAELDCRQARRAVAPRRPYNEWGNEGKLARGAGGGAQDPVVAPKTQSQTDAVAYRRYVKQPTLRCVRSDEHRAAERWERNPNR